VFFFFFLKEWRITDKKQKYFEKKFE